MILALAACSNEERTTPGAEPAVVPTLSGLPVAEAVRAVQGAGLRPELRASGTPVPLDGCTGGTVVGQDEAPGAALVRGSTVVVDVACVTASPRP